jgi:hypothetical protein
LTRKPLSKRQRPRLQDVTLVAVSSVAHEATIKALEASMAQAQFGQVLLLSDTKLAGLRPAISWRRIEPIRSRSDYSRFMLRGLADHISTSHALCVQWDGFVLRGEAWDASFLLYDYIGAVWPQFRDGHNVGNGGFSLRSKRLLNACKALPLKGCAEDLVISRLYRTYLEEQGLRFAPEDVARCFAFERTPPTGMEFGFHGIFNLIPQISAHEALDLLRSLEPNLLTRGEHFELLRWALARGRGRLALTLLSRLWRR